jgi:hypothetical protein
MRNTHGRRVGILPEARSWCAKPAFRPGKSEDHQLFTNVACDVESVVHDDRRGPAFAESVDGPEPWGPSWGHCGSRPFSSQVPSRRGPRHWGQSGSGEAMRPSVCAGAGQAPTSSDARMTAETADVCEIRTRFIFGLDFLCCVRRSLSRRFPSVRRRLPR